jgi:hypothetical protein
MKQHKEAQELAAVKPSADSAPRKAYQRPVLRTFGSVHRMTQGSGGKVPDGGGTKRKPQGGGSDRAIKDNIVRIGEHPLGIGLYLFDYKAEYRDLWGNGRQFGVMADEVETVMPDAVSVHLDGYKLVDYPMLGIRREA